ncbi:MAG: hypothetical protein JXA21_03980 [Anaerolineae bacterium]|nr:hypothetical protein [Anaerolineae bacterium]
MNSVRVIYHLARADFYERIRRYSFLVVLGLSVFLGYQVAIGNVTLTLGAYRGEYNSAWVGAMLSLVATFFIGWLGFYVVKGSVARDRDTGVGQIMATTPLSRPLYMLGKWLSNLTVLMTMVGVLALAGIVLQLWKGESLQIDLVTFLAPFLFIVLPCMALVAAFAVLFESIPFLRGGFGNIVYFMMFMMFIPLIVENLDSAAMAFEPLGMGLLQKDMGEAVRAVYPDYTSAFSLGATEVIVTNTFLWTGIAWTPPLIMARFALIGLAILLTLLAALFFDRFDPSRTKPRRKKTGVAHATLEPAATPGPLPTVQLTLLDARARRFNFFSVLLAELKLLLKGQRWWWYAIAGALIFACIISPAPVTREIVLPLAWAWPTLIWSVLGNRERRHNVQQLTFSAAAPLWRQLPAQWLAGFLVALLMGSGALLRLTLAGDATGLLALFSGALFIPSLALATGVWSGASKLFEILYIAILYIGPLNRVAAVDFTGATGTGRPEFFIPFSLVLLACALLGRVRQVRHVGTAY